jgi:hypothetical protein
LAQTFLTDYVKQIQLYTFHETEPIRKS